MDPDHLKAKIENIAKALFVRHRPDAPLERDNRGLWWLMGLDGDTPLIGTKKCKTMLEAVEVTEKWITKAHKKNMKSKNQ